MWELPERSTLGQGMRAATWAPRWRKTVLKGPITKEVKALRRVKQLEERVFYEARWEQHPCSTDALVLNAPFSSNFSLALTTSESQHTEVVEAPESKDRNQAL
eukprot:6212621-Pleurochrysis_carterae.AAC.3